MESFKAAFIWPYIGTQALAGVIAIIIWRKYFYAISDVPGPFLASFTRLWHHIRISAGDQNLQLMILHDAYGRLLPDNEDRSKYPSIETLILGHFVRISYDEISVSHPEAVRKLLLAPIPKVFIRIKHSPGFLWRISS